MGLRAISPLVRSDFAQSPPANRRPGDLTDSFVHATEEPFPYAEGALRHAR
jgi:hypothetical protein